MAAMPEKPKLFYRIAGTLLARYIRLVHRTCWQTEAMTEAMEVQYKHHPAIIAMWHGQFMLLPLIKPTFIPVDIMVAKHGDAELLGVALQDFEMRLIRGAGAGGRDKDRGGREAFRGAVQAIREGRTIAMTADIPGATPREAGMGIVMIARASQRPIMPVAIATSRYLALNTWSRMTINLPFTGMGFSVGPLIHVPFHATGEEMEGYRQQVEDALNLATKTAYARAGADPTRATPGKGGPGFRLRIYRGLTRLAQPFAPLLLRRRASRGKEELARSNERMGRPLLKRPEGTLIWFHAASVGETLAALPVLDALRSERPNARFLLTTGTVTSAKVAAERLGPGVIHQYVPLDTPQFVRGFLEHWKPDLAVFTESEIWPNLILECSWRDVPLVLINARMTERSYQRWRNNRAMARRLFSRFRLVLAQNAVLGRRFTALGAPKVEACGNLKVDAPLPPVDPDAYASLKAALGARPVLVAASTHEGEEQVIADAHRMLKAQLPDLCTIIAPRHPGRGDAVAEMLRAQGLRFARRSRNQPLTHDSEIYLADTIGELGLFYKLGSVAFIGGSLVEHGGQNPIEAVRHDAMVLTGPDRSNFTDAYDALFARDAAIEVRSAEDVAAAVRKLLADPNALAAMRARATEALNTVAGALPHTVSALLRYIPREKERERVS